MAQRKQQRRRPSAGKPVRKKAPSSRKKTYFNPQKPEFKADPAGTGFLKKLYMTRQQRMTLARWGLYIGLLILLLVIQDVIMSRISIFGATTDLVACAILLITVMEGTEVGSVFVLVASALYYFSGSSPGPYSVAMLTIFGIGAAMFRQAFWHRNLSSIVLCAGLAQIVFELATCLMGIFLGLTYWGRIGSFLVTGLLSTLIMIPLYPLINKIGQIGGRTWKE